MTEDFNDKEKEIVKKYREKLKKQFDKDYEDSKLKTPGNFMNDTTTTSSNYESFKDELKPRELTTYEKMCRTCGKIFPLNPGKGQTEKIQKHIDFAHLQLTPEGATSFAFLSTMGIGIPLALILFFFLQSQAGALIMIFISASLALGFLKLPEIAANNWRLKVSNQMVEAIFYIGTYLRNTSNLEQAIRFASERIHQPLSLDLKKIVWDVETHKYDSISESLENYLFKWKKWNPEFVESIHLLESSLFEGSEQKRLDIIDRAIKLMLEETYNKMLKFSHNLKGPLTMLYMLGIVLPIIGMILLPIVTSFLSGDQSPFKSMIYIILIYNLSFPAITYFVGKNILSKRPTGYGSTDIQELNPELKQQKKVDIKIGNSKISLSPLYLSAIIFFPLFLIGLLPFILGLTLPSTLLLSEPGIGTGGLIKVLEYRLSSITGTIIGPYGLIASILSLLITAAIGVSIGIYHSVSSSKLSKIRDKTKEVEKDFSSSLFQLGNRIGDGIPPEAAFEKITIDSENEAAHNFFKQVTLNIRNKGMGLNAAIFDKTRGALRNFPSNIIESSMKILVESSRKGPKIASQAIINVSSYISDINRVNERIKDLLSDIISDMKQQIAILAPAIAGVVVGITSMVVTLLNVISDQVRDIASSDSAVTAIPVDLIDIFGEGLPTYYFQIIIGIYIIQITYILTILINGIENGSDKTSESHSIGQNLIKSTLIYVLITGVCVLLFNLIGIAIVGTL